MAVALLNSVCVTSLRCYSIYSGLATQVAAKCRTYDQLVDVASTSITPPPIAFLKRKDLPPMFNCDLIAFSRGIKLRYADAGCFPLPDQHYAADEISERHCPGFPVPRPADRINPDIAFSFGEKELSAFLKHFTDFAGRMVVVNLEGPTGGVITEKECLFIVNFLVNDLMRYIKNSANR